MDRGYSSGVNREEPETTTLLPFCDKLFIYSNDDDNDDDERKSEFGGPSSARSVKISVEYFIIRFHLLLSDEIVCLQRLAYYIVLKKRK